EKELLSPCEGGFIADGSLDVEDLFEAMNLEMPEAADEEEEADSVSGLVADRLGRIPGPGEHAVVEWGGVRFEVLAADERRIETVRCTLAGAEAQEEAE